MNNHVYGICSSYFNPLHNGHLHYIEQSYYYILEKTRHILKQEGFFYVEDNCSLFCIVNNDAQVKLKKSIPFLDQETRTEIINELNFVDDVFTAIDKDKTVAKTLEQIIQTYNIGEDDLVCFFNSGDRKEPDPQEDEMCKKYGIEQVFLDLPKINSSSEILDRVGEEWHKRYMSVMEKYVSSYPRPTTPRDKN